jgi:hypothetical protein
MSSHAYSKPASLRGSGFPQNITAWNKRTWKAIVSGEAAGKSQRSSQVARKARSLSWRLSVKACARASVPSWEKAVVIMSEFLGAYVRFRRFGYALSISKAVGNQKVYLGEKRKGKAKEKEVEMAMRRS